MSERRVSLPEVAAILGDIKQACDDAWESPPIVAARERLKAKLDHVATLSPAEQQAYWDGVSARLKAKIVEFDVDTAAKKAGHK